MSEKNNDKKERSETYDSKLKIKGTLQDVLKVSVPANEKKQEKEN